MIKMAQLEHIKKLYHLECLSIREISKVTGHHHRTPESAYYIPILQALNNMGGSAKMQPLASDPDMPRWRNAAQWARNSMVKEGLLKADSPRGVWEI